MTEEQSEARTETETETILQPGDSSVREESDQYEEVCVLKRDQSMI